VKYGRRCRKGSEKKTKNSAQKAHMEQRIKGNKEENARKFRVEVNILFRVRVKKKSITLICKLVHCFLD